MVVKVLKALVKWLKFCSQRNCVSNLSDDEGRIHLLPHLITWAAATTSNVANQEQTTFSGLTWNIQNRKLTEQHNDNLFNITSNQEYFVIFWLQCADKTGKATTVAWPFFSTIKLLWIECKFNYSLFLISNISSPTKR